MAQNQKSVVQIKNEKEPKPDEVEEEEAIADSEQTEKKQPESEQEKYAQLREQTLRLAAEFDNYKKRVKKEIDNAENMGKASLINDMLPVIDEFELAIMAMGNSKEHVAKGIEMLYSNFMDVLKKEGLKEVEADGIFDPYKHEIIMVRESDKKDGTILEVVKKGYMFETRLIRPTSVIISKKKEQKDEVKTEN
jgi:molecular chaperone GrpE